MAHGGTELGNARCSGERAIVIAGGGRRDRDSQLRALRSDLVGG